MSMLCAYRSIYVAVFRNNTQLSLVWFAMDIYAHLLPYKKMKFFPPRKNIFSKEKIPVNLQLHVFIMLSGQGMDTVLQMGS